MYEGQRLASEQELTPVPEENPVQIQSKSIRSQFIACVPDRGAYLKTKGDFIIFFLGVLTVWHFSSVQQSFALLFVNALCHGLRAGSSISNLPLGEVVAEASCSMLQRLHFAPNWFRNMCQETAQNSGCTAYWGNRNSCPVQVSEVTGSKTGLWHGSLRRHHNG